VRILVTGRKGQVARSLAERAPAGFDIIFAGRPELDLAAPDTIEQTVAAASPDLIISAAAYTAVDQAEDEPERAQLINGEAPGVLAHAAREAGAPIIHISTDYVFDGSLDRPYVEDDKVGPVGAYGRSKLAGEEAVRVSGADHLILRTAWVYSPFGNNFVKTMLRLADGRDRLTVVEDQLGNPTSALDIADGIFAVAARLREGSGGLNATYHLAGTGSTDWANFARHIFAASAEHGGPTADVEGIPSSQWPTKATRPANSRLDSSKLSKAFGYTAPDWRSSVNEVVRRLVTT